MYIVKEAEVLESTKYFPESKEQYEDLKNFVFEKSTMSLIHYFEQHGKTNSNGKVNVCDTHKGS